MKMKLSVAGLLVVFFLLAFTSSLGDSNTMDEVAHTPAGYSYIVKRDMRLNPEHPPLLKDAAGLSVWLGAKLSGTHINFNDRHPAWANDVNGQWEWGFDWLFRQGNDADKIIFWARLPMIALGVLLGWHIFRFGREFFSARVGLLALFFYAFSPTVLAHTRLVTTDVGAALGFFIAVYYFLKWHAARNNTLEVQTPKHSSWFLVKAGLAFGAAQLLKFSTFLLVPYFAMLVLVFVLAHASTVPAPPWSRVKYALKKLLLALGGLLAVFAIGYVLLWPVYAYHAFGYPAERQRRDTQFILTSFAHGPPKDGERVCNPFGVQAKRFVRCAAEVANWASDKPLLRPYAQYLLGLLMVIQRSTGGNTTYFLGEISAAGWRNYFPLVYLFKEPLALHILTAIAFWLAVKRLWQQRPESIDALTNRPASTRQRLSRWIVRHPAEFAALFFIVAYWAQSIASNLNIGVRHALPTFPFIFLLVARQIARWLRIKEINLSALGVFKALRHLLVQSLAIIAKYALVAALLVWQAAAALTAFPHYLAYFNGLVGTDNGYRVVVDSNYDWGQDLKRLSAFVRERDIKTIKLYYFGGSVPEYYLGQRHESLDPQQGPQQGWLAISATLLQGGRGDPAPGFRESTTHFKWLDAYEPVARAGKSIFIYYIP